MSGLRPVLLVAFATALSLLGDQMLYAVLPSYYPELGLLPIHVGLLLSVNRWVRLLTNRPAEWLSRRFSGSLLMGAALALGALSTASYAVFPSFAALLVARMIWGASWSLIRQVGMMTVVANAAPGRMGRMMGLYSGLSRLGSVSGNLLGAVGHDAIGFGGILLVFAVVSGLGAPLGAWGSKGLEAVDPDSAAAQTPPWNWGVMVGGFVVGCVGHGLIMSTLGAVLKAEVGEQLVIGGTAVGVATLTGALLAGRWIADLAAPLLGGFADRAGRRVAGTVCFGVGAAVLSGAALVGGALALVGLVLLYFICATGATVALAAEAGMGGARGVSRYVTAADLGGAVGPMLGWVAPQLGLPVEVSLGLGGAFYAVAAAALWWGMDRRQQRG